jgi:GrpB-like predicted nucleotidyltransferase (UPF0157 family)
LRFRALLPMTMGMTDELKRLVLCCLIPKAGAEALEDVRAHYRDADPRVQVVVERRVRQRRGSPLAEAPQRPDRRAGTDRRRFVVPRRLPALPLDLQARTGPVSWIQRLLPVGAATEALSHEDVVAAVRAGDPEAPTELYWRYYERVHSRLCVLLGDAAEADATIVRTFGRVLDALDNPKRAREAFDLLLYDEVEATASEVLQRRGSPNELPDGGLGLLDPELDEAVRVRDADPHWAPLARTERDRLLELLTGSVVAIEHVGGTAIPKVAGRHIVDLLAGVHRLPLSEDELDALDRIGYEDCGSGGVAGRVYLRRRGRTKVDLHVVEYGGALWHDTLMLREYLRRHPGEAARWGQVKGDAARTSPTSAIRYYDMRRLVLEELLDRARRESVQRAA